MKIASLSKRIIAIITSILFIMPTMKFFIVTGTTTSNYYSTYIQRLIGTPAKEWGGADGTQCVELIKYYIEQLWGIKTKNVALGNGNEIYKKVAHAYPDYFTAINYYDGLKLMPGDIISYHSSGWAADYGHAALVYEVNGNSYKIAEQAQERDYVWSNTKDVKKGEYGVPYTIIGIARPNNYTADEVPSDVLLTNNQYWYDINDVIKLNVVSNNAYTYWLSIIQGDNHVVNEKIYGEFSINANDLGYGDYHAWVSAENPLGTTDSNHLNFSVVGPPTYIDIFSEKEAYTIEDTVSITVNSICAKGHVIGIDKVGEGRIITTECDSTYTINAKELGTGEYSAYFSVYNGSGTIDTERVNFNIYDKAPTWGKLEIVSPKDSYTVGDTIMLKASSDYGTGYWIGIDKGDLRLITEEMHDGLYSFEIKEEGEYSAYVSIASSLGGIDSKRIFFNAYNNKMLTFNPNGGTTPTTTKSILYNTAYGSLPKPTRTGYTFDGWYTAKDGGTLITEDLIVSVTTDQTLYAHWTLNPYTVTLDANGGTVSDDSVTVTYSNGYGTLPEPTRDGYTFLGWFTAADGGTEVTASTTVTTNKDHTLYAHWQKNKAVGDVNADGTFNVADVVMLQKWLICTPNATLTDWQAADFCNDGRIDVFDLCIMKRELLNN